MNEAYGTWIDVDRVFVSIPFKRESTCEPETEVNNNESKAFQFPSNGKARVNMQNECDGGLQGGPVSIPFKRESTCEHKWKSFGFGLLGFQFPSNGKARVNIQMFREKDVPREFQFPSNGKARVNMVGQQVVIC